MKLSPRTLRFVARNKWTREKRAGEVAPIEGQLCVDCGNSAQEHDHRNYIRYADVVPVCRKCNSKRGQGFPPTNGKDVEVFWYTKDPKTIVYRPNLNKDDMKMLRAYAKELGVSRADAIRHIIKTLAKRKKVWE